MQAPLHAFLHSFITLRQQFLNCNLRTPGVKTSVELRLFPQEEISAVPVGEVVARLELIVSRPIISIKSQTLWGRHFNNTKGNASSEANL